MKNLEIREALASDAPGIRLLLSKTFGSEIPAEEWSWKFERNPDGWFGIVALLGGEIVGNYAGWGMRFLLEGEETLLYSVGDVATDRSVRTLGGRQGVYRSMAEAFYDTVGARGVPFCFGFPNARALEISHRIVGSRTLFPIRQVLVPCGSFGVPPAGAAAADHVGEEFDPFWERARGILEGVAVRDRSRVNWRFHARPTRYYRMVGLAEERSLAAWAALSVTGEEALVADYLGLEADGRDLPALFAAAGAEAAGMGARRLVFWEPPGGPGRRILHELPGERREAGFPMIVRSFDDGAAGRFAERLHLTPSLYDLV